MSPDLINSFAAALELLDAELITVQDFINICQTNDWEIVAREKVKEDFYLSTGDSNAERDLNASIRLVYSKY